MSRFQLTETRKADRLEMAKAVRDLAHEYGLTVEIDRRFEKDRETWVKIRHPESGLGVTVIFDGRSAQPDTHVLSWNISHRDAQREAYILPGFANSRNEYHHRKATDVCYGFHNLAVILEFRFAAIEEGEAIYYADADTVAA